MKKGSVSLHNLGSFPSPGAPNYRDSTAVAAQKGWSSERVPHPGNKSRRHISAASMTPFYSGRSTLPSKWEDAERWICSPVLGYGGVSKNPNFQVQKRPKSKSGPIGAPGVAFYPNCSPMQVGDGGGGSVKRLVAASPFSTGVLMPPDGVSGHYGGFSGGATGGGAADVTRSSSLPGWSELVKNCSSLIHQDEKLREVNDGESGISHNVSRRDMATQMSSDSSGSSHSSPKERASISSSPLSMVPSSERNDHHPSKMEIREVQVDKRVTMTNRSRRHGSRVAKKETPDVEDFYHTDEAASSTCMDISDATSGVCKLQREEAKISAWENLQRAKAEAAIRKLEVKLEKKRSASMDKILSKLRTAQTKAQEMRSIISGNNNEQKKQHIPGKGTFICKLPGISSLSCFACPPRYS